MESAAVARAAEAVGAKFASVRAVVDPADFRLPQVALHALGPDGKVRVARSILEIFKYPFEIPDVLRLSMFYREALGRLNLAARELCH